MTIRTEPDGKRWAPHAPGAVLDYSVDWTEWLMPGETVSVSNWAASAGITLSRQAVTYGAVATTFASGGVAGQVYVLTNTVTTTDGRTDSRTIALRCRAR